MTEVSPKILTRILLNLVCKNIINLTKFHARRQAHADFFPGFMILSLTTRCNLACQGCWVGSKEQKDLPLDTAREVIRSSLAMGSSYFGLVGGEPLLYPHLYTLLQEFPNAYFQLFTNGTLLSETVAKKLARLGNVTPLISIEGLKEESDRRRNGKDVYSSALTALANCTKHRLLTGVATSVCATNIDDLVSDDFVSEIIRRRAHYLWYYIYRPVGPRPHPELALNQDQILQLRRFIVDARLRHPIGLVDAYWDENGRAICPGTAGLSHHLNPEGFLEFCPPLQFAFKQLKPGDNFTNFMANDKGMSRLRTLVGNRTPGCIILNDPQFLYKCLKELNAVDSSGRNAAFEELAAMCPKPCHHITGQEIPEKSLLYKFAKKFSFFGFSAYG